MKIRPATKDDFDDVRNLLVESRLPTEGVTDSFANFVVAEDGTSIAGAVGLERFGEFALLRSAVVSPARQGEGVGALLVERILENARETGVREVYLLTTTAEKYFPRFGFEQTTRAAVPAAVKASAEFRGACPDSAVVMKRSIAP